MQIKLVLIGVGSLSSRHMTAINTIIAIDKNFSYNLLTIIHHIFLKLGEDLSQGSSFRMICFTQHRHTSGPPLKRTTPSSSYGSRSDYRGNSCKDVT